MYSCTHSLWYSKIHCCFSWFWLCPDRFLWKVLELSWCRTELHRSRDKVWISVCMKKYLSDIQYSGMTPLFPLFSVPTVNCWWLSQGRIEHIYRYIYSLDEKSVGEHYVNASGLELFKMLSFFHPFTLQGTSQHLAVGVGYYVQSWTVVLRAWRAVCSAHVQNSMDAELSAETLHAGLLLLLQKDLMSWSPGQISCARWCWRRKGIQNLTCVPLSPQL